MKDHFEKQIKQLIQVDFEMQFEETNAWKEMISWIFALTKSYTLVFVKRNSLFCCTIVLAIQIIFLRAEETIEV